jgi:hypothetical protein
MTHTPGPWVVTGEMDRFHGGEWIRPLDSEGHQKSELVAVVCDFNRSDRDAERQANAHLIAAGPDLLAAADIALRTINDTLRHVSSKALVDVAEQLHVAIAKAEGREP